MSLLVDDLRLHPAEYEGDVPRGDFVLYWMQTTQRVDDNFALTCAIERANLLHLPVLVYHELGDDYPCASDRFHTFALQGVVDLYEECERLGIQYAFSLSREPLVQLADRAALVITDFFPTARVPQRIAAFRERTRTPVIAVDSCVVVPLRYLTTEYASAAAIRPVLRRALSHFLTRLPAVEPRIRDPVDLPFEPVRPTDATIPALVAACDIDHTVRPVQGIRGGPKAARARLYRFAEHGFGRYLEARGDPNDEHGTSRLSPYLHFGHISMHEVLLTVRELELPDQYEEFLDEALVWRELAHNFAFYNAGHRTLAGMPYWASEELRRGEYDPRPVIYAADELEQARTEDDLWNAAQRAYAVDGWVHNAVRMLWGKALLQWTPSVAECFRLMVHLNNKYALDGNDPNSFAGIHWTLGRFDRPFYRRPIYGAVRYQSLKSARKRFDVRAYVERYAAASSNLSPRA